MQMGTLTTFSLFLLHSNDEKSPDIGMNEWSLHPGYFARESPFPDVRHSDVPSAAQYIEPTMEDIRRIIRPTTAIVRKSVNEGKDADTFLPQRQQLKTKWNIDLDFMAVEKKEKIV